MHGVDDVYMAKSAQRDNENRFNDERYGVKFIEIRWRDFCNSGRHSVLIV